MLEVSIKVLKERLESRPYVPAFHFPSWDFPYMRDIKKLEEWISDFSKPSSNSRWNCRKTERSQKQPLRS
jgi:hypothetical protein